MIGHIHILQHSLGVDKYGSGRQYRNHFVTDPAGADYEACISLCQIGLMASHGRSELCGGMHVFVVTDEGKKFVVTHSEQEPKLTRAQKQLVQSEKLASIGLDAADPSTPAQFASYIRAETERWSRVIKASGFKVE